MKSYSTVSGPAVPLPRDNVDTDQIIPASFLKGLDREGLAEGLFHGWRFQADGSPDPAFPLNDPEAAQAEILLVGENFGCGSSREHAPWALLAAGFRVILGRSFADIFRGNAHRNGLLTVALSPARHEALLAAVLETPDAAVSVSLETQEITFPDGAREGFEVDPFTRHCMLTGTDPLGHLLNHVPEIQAYEDGRPSWASIATSKPKGL